MLILPLWGISAAAILTIFMPLIVDVQHPSISLLQDFSQNVFENLKFRLGITEKEKEDEVPIPTPSVKIPTAVRIESEFPTMFWPIGYIDPTCPTCLWEGPDSWIWTTIDPTVMVTPITRTATSTSFTSVIPSKVVMPWHSWNSSLLFTPTFSPTNIPTYDVPNVSRMLWLPMSTVALLAIVHGVVIFRKVCSKMSEKQDANFAAAKQSRKIRNLGKSKVVLAYEKEELGLEELLKNIESQAGSLETNKDKDIAGGPPYDIDLPLHIVEYLYVEEEPSPARLISIKRWEITKSEFEEKYVWSSVPRTPSLEPPTVVSKSLVGRPPKPIHTNPSTAPPTPTVVPDRHVGGADEVDTSLRTLPSSDSSGFPVPRRDNDAGEPLTVVISSDRHVGGTPVVNVPSGGTLEEPAVFFDAEEEIKPEGLLLPLITLSPAPRLEPGEDSVPPVPIKRRRRRNRMGQRQRRKRREEFEARMAEEVGEGEEAGEEEEEEEGEEEAPVGDEIENV
jgi:hypothetical protein